MLRILEVFFTRAIESLKHYYCWMLRLLESGGYSLEIYSAESVRFNLNVTEREISQKFLRSLKREGVGERFSPHSASAILSSSDIRYA